MKIQSNPFLRRSALALLGLAAAWSSAQATSLYWDGNDVAAGAGTAPYGTWGTDAFWNTDATGGGAGAFQFTTTATDNLQFVAAPAVGSGDTAYVVTVDGTQAANSLTVLNPASPTFTGGIISLGAGGISVPQYYTGTTANANRVTFNSTLNLTANQTWTFNNNSGNAYVHIACDFTGSGNITQTGIGGNRIYAGSSAGWTGSLTLNGSGLTFGTSQQAQTRLNNSTLTMRNAGTSNPSMTIYLDNGGVTNFRNNIVFDNAGAYGWNFNQNNGSGSVGAVEVLSGTLSGSTNGQVLFSSGDSFDFSGVGLHGQTRLSGNNSGWTSTRATDAVWIRTGYLYLDSPNALGTNNSISLALGQANGAGQGGGGLFAPNGITVTCPVKVNTNPTAGALTGETYLGLDGAGATTFSSNITLQNLVATSSLAGNNLHLRALPGGTVTFSGSIADGGTSQTWNNPILVDGGGTVVLTGSSHFYGTTYVNAGTLKLDFAARTLTTNILNSTGNFSPLVLGGGTLSMTGKASNFISQQFNGTSFNAGSSAVVLTANATSNPLLLTLGALTRNPAATADFIPPIGTQNASNGIVTTSTGFVSNNVLVSAATNGVAYATSGGADWANQSGGNIIKLASYNANSFTSTDNANVTGSQTPAAGITVNTLRFNDAPATTLTLSGTNTVSTGGLLVTAATATNGVTIAGGNLQAGGGKELVLINNGKLAVSSAIVNNSTASALTVAGTGTTTLSGANTYSGVTTVTGGTLSVANLGNALGTGTSPLVLGGGSTKGILSYTGNSASYTKGVILDMGGGEIDVTTAGQTLTLGSPTSASVGVSYVAAVETFGVRTNGVFGDLTLGGPGNITIANATLGQGWGGLIKNGPGTLTLNSGGTAVVLAGWSYSGTTIYTLEFAGGAQVGQVVSGSGVVTGTTVTAVSGTTVTLSAATTGLVQSATFTTPGATAFVVPGSAPFGVLAGSAFYGVINGSATSGSNTYTATVATNVAIGQLVTGTGIPANTTVTNVVGTAVTLSANTTAAVTNATFASNVYTLTTAGGVVRGASVTGTGIPAGTTVKAVSGTAVTLSAYVTATATSATFNSNVYTLASAGGVQIGQTVSGTGIPTNTKVLAVSGTTVTLSAFITAAVTNATFTTSNSYTGTTTINAGTVVLGSASAIPAQSPIVINGATLDIGPFSTTSSNAPVTLNDGGSIIGTTSISGIGTLNMGSNTLFVTGGTAIVVNGSATAPAVRAGTATSGSTTYTLTTAGGVVVGQTVSGQGVASGSTVIAVSGTTVTLSSATTGAVSNATFSSNIYLLSSPGNVYVGQAVTGPGIVSGTTVTAVSGTTVTLSIATTALVTNATFATNSTITARLSGPGSSVQGSLVKTGAGTLTLNNTNTSTGATTISGGTVATVAQNALSTGAMTISGGTLALSTSSSTVGAVTMSSGSITGTDIAGPATNYYSTGVLSGTSFNMTNSGTVTAILADAYDPYGFGATLTKSGAGTLTLSGANSLTGTTTILSGTLAFGADYVLAYSPVVVAGGTLDLATFQGWCGSVTLSSGTITGTGTSQLLQSYAFNLTDSGTVNVPLADPYAGAQSILTKTGAGTATLNKANTYTGSTLINGGTLALSVTGSIADSADVTVGAGATLDTTAKTSYTLPAVLTLGVDSSGTSGQIKATGKTLVISSAAVTFNVSGTLAAPVYVLATYGTKTGAAFASVTGLPAGYAINYSYNSGTQIALIQSDPFIAWAATPAFGLSVGQQGKSADPDGDGLNNITEFALDGNPGSGKASGKVVGKVATVGGSKTLVLTLPVRATATFTAPGAPTNYQLVSGAVDGLVYQIQSGTGLASWTQAVSEVTGSDKTAIETGLPALTSSSWTYRTFRCPVPVTGNPKEFLRAAVIAQP